jgi:hypothetical protein
MNPPQGTLGHLALNAQTVSVSVKHDSLAAAQVTAHNAQDWAIGPRAQQYCVLDGICHEGPRAIKA